MAATSTSVFLLLFLLHFAISISAADAAAAPALAPALPPALPPALMPHRQRVSCANELVLFSPCLPYVSAPPNNLTATVTSQCCSVLSSAINTGAGDCLCYLLRQPMIFGFPLDTSRVVSLSKKCTGRSRYGSLESICSPSELPELPPLQSTDTTSPFDSGDGSVAASSLPSVGLPPETKGETSPDLADVQPKPTVKSPSRPRPRPRPRSIPFRAPMSSGTIQIPKTTVSWFQPAILIYALSSCILAM